MFCKAILGLHGEDIRRVREAQLVQDRMKKSLTVWFFSALLALPAPAAMIQGRVVGISDGDTVTVLDANKVEHKIRLAGIDAPEKSQPFGSQSKQHLSDLVFGKVVAVDWTKTDKYGRIVGKVMIGGKDANLNQVQAGMAWHYKAYEKEQSPTDRVEYAQAEANARTQRVGLWRDTNPTPPWDFRHGTGDAYLEVQANAGVSCPCNGRTNCTGPRGGHYCTTAAGKKKYL